MKVKMLTSMAGMNFSHHPGQIVDLSKKAAEARIEAGHAVEVLDAEAAQHETEQTVARATARESEQQSEIDRLTAQVSRIQKSNADLKERNKDLRKENSGLKQDRSNLSDKLGRAERLLNKLRATADESEVADGAEKADGETV